MSHPESDATLPPKHHAEPETLAPAGAAIPGAGELPRPFGRYRLEKLLGRGGMGAVYLALDTQLNRPVALKLPALAGPGAAATRARFLREAQSAAALQHPNICPIYDVGEIDGTPYLTMAFVPGESLAKRVGPGRPFEPRAAVELTRTLALALAYAHEHGVIHRDLKPANVMLDERGEPVVMDFGLARRADLIGDQLTRQGDLLGTPAYMPPEQITGDVAAMGPASDVYALGVMLFELLTGDLPFHGDLLALVSQVTLDEPPWPSTVRPGLDPRLDALCLAALAKKPAGRYPSMRAFADALAGWLATGGPALTLRVVGTPYSYRPLPGQAVISVGRQRRRPGDPDDTGNDMVLRVPGDDASSTRISRRHFEIHRDGDRYFVTDRSKVGTLRNGQPLPRGVAVPLAAGDRLVVAGVLELEVALDAGAAALRVARPEVELRAGGPILEATLGDMVTME